MFKRIDHVEIIPADLERTKAFYLDILGFTLKDEMTINTGLIDAISYLTLGDTMIELLSVVDPIRPHNPPMPVGYHAIALEVDDMEQTVEYLKGKGVDISWGPLEVGHAKRAEIRDPDELVIELRQWLK